MDPILYVENLCHTYAAGTSMEKKALDNIQLTIQPGEYLGIIGQTGSGKSTFVQHLNGLLRPTAGNVFFKGEDIFSSKEKTREVRFKVGLVFQYPEYQLFEESVYKDIAFGPKNMNLTEKQIRERVYEAIQFVGLSEDILQRSPFALSGGQKRRVAIAGVIAMRPEVLILDEPAAGLDPAGCEEIANNIENYHKATQAAVIMISHNMEDVARCADRMMVMQKGKSVMQGTPTEIFSQSQRLQELGLSVPAATGVALELKNMGIPLDTAVFTPEQLVQSILRSKAGWDRA